MKLVKDYLHMAEEARKMARNAPPEQRAAIKNIAETWEEMAAQREEVIEHSRPERRKKPRSTREK